MRRLDRYILGSMLRIITTTVVLVTLILLLFDIFSNLEQYIDNATSYRDIARLTAWYIPEAIGYALGPASLFAATYFLAMLHANNEMIVLSNIGYPFRRIVFPMVLLGVLLAIFQFVFSEEVTIKATREKELLGKEILGIRTSSENRNVTLRSPAGDYVVFAKRYDDENRTISSVMLIMLDSEGSIAAKIDASSGFYQDGYWVLRDVVRYLIDDEADVVEAYKEPEYHNRAITMDPALFRNLQADITSMELDSAIRYVQRIKMMDSNQYMEYASDLADRIFGGLTPLILIVISCSTVFTWRKNVLILSILTSLAIAVVYFVMQMVSMILAKQGIIPPVLGPTAPMLILTVLSVGVMAVRRI